MLVEYTYLGRDRKYTCLFQFVAALNFLKKLHSFLLKIFPSKFLIFYINETCVCITSFIYYIFSSIILNFNYMCCFLLKEHCPNHNNEKSMKME